MTLLKEIYKTYGGLFEQKISHTTRPKKAMEKGSTYYHITKEDFMRVSDLILTLIIREWKETNSSNGAMSMAVSMGQPM